MTHLLLFCTAALGQADTFNLDFRRASLQGWDGAGFYLTSGSARGPGLTFGACSSDAGNPTQKGMVRYVLRVPSRASKLVCRAFAATPLGMDADNRLDVVLAGAGEAIVPRQVRTAGGWSANSQLLSRWQGEPRTYAWSVGHLQGQVLQVVLIDQDDRPGCHVYATGFDFQGADEFQDDEFIHTMVDLQAKHKLEPLSRYDSKRFTALSNASEKFSMQRLRFCESIYDLFYVHFQRKGFTLHSPGQRLMLAIFDSPEGFDAYLDTKMPAGITGIYHRGTNRLFIYDLRSNRFLVDQREQALKKGTGIQSSLDRGKFVDTVWKKYDDIAWDVNLSTTMHETAHQLSFNSGLMNRQGDVPVWLAEGLACYCEATDQGDWQALGSPNPGRIDGLRRCAAGTQRWIPLEEMIRSDAWLGTSQVLQGYAQSWALFHMLMHEQPQALRGYLRAVYERRVPEYRRDDFQAAFGDLSGFETRYHAYVQKLVSDRPAR